MAAESALVRVWRGRLIFTGCAGLLIFGALLPLGFEPTFTPSPDLLFSLTLAIVLRRPEFVPFWLLAPIFLLADILLMRPPGLWTAIVLLAAEFTRAQEYRFRDLVFPFEWGFIAAVIFLALLANRILLFIALVPLPGFGAVMLHFIVTIMVYPLVVFFCYSILRIRKVTPDVAVRFGHRL